MKRWLGIDFVTELSWCALTLLSSPVCQDIPVLLGFTLNWRMLFYEWLVMALEVKIAIGLYCLSIHRCNLGMVSFVPNQRGILSLHFFLLWLRADKVSSTYIIQKRGSLWKFFIFFSFNMLHGQFGNKYGNEGSHGCVISLR